MPTEHKKTKSKATTNPEIKVEGKDLHPLSHYIDDRVELIRQIFMILKSKTIKSIAPDFMQGKTLETIQEYCLDELLGISNKRLRSIINATQCPDNTDSSDSDVENIEEHISLEEISSDSADDAPHAKKSKGKSKASDNKNGKAGATGSGKKEVSVLELLELQARARAIRSQLALEPVTKIELDSDNDSADGSSPKIVKSSTSTATTAADNIKDQSSQAKTSTKNVVQESNGMQIIKPSIPAVKPVRLKRNFRQRQNDDYDPDEDDETKSLENELKDADKKSVDEQGEKIADDVNPDEKKPDEIERSPSPDLIPIIQEPETYILSSDSDDGGSSSVPKYITYPTVVREKLPETEDEKFLKKIKERSGVDLRDLIKARRGEKQVEVEITIRRSPTSSKNVESSSEEIPVNKTDQQSDKDTEPEEGELTDGDDEMEANQITILSSDDENEQKSNKCVTVQRDVAETVKDETSSESSASSDNESDTDESDAPIFKEADDDDDIIDLGKDEELDFEMKAVEQSETKNKKIKKTKKKLKIAEKTPNEAVSEATEDENNHEKSDDDEKVKLNIEMTESTATNDASEVKEPATVADPSDEIEPATVADPSDEIEPATVADPSDEIEPATVADPSEEIEPATVADPSEEMEPAIVADPSETDTWQTRWLRGRNVTKVMATSRLANKVRTKIKQKKSKTEQESVNPVPDVDSPSVEAVTSLVEEGSVQHYEVLIAQETDNKNE